MVRIKPSTSCESSIHGMAAMMKVKGEKLGGKGFLSSIRYMSHPYCKYAFGPVDTPHARFRRVPRKF